MSNRKKIKNNNRPLHGKKNKSSKVPPNSDASLKDDWNSLPVGGLQCEATSNGRLKFHASLDDGAQEFILTPDKALGWTQEMRKQLSECPEDTEAFGIRLMDDRVLLMDINDMPDLLTGIEDIANFLKNPIPIFTGSRDEIVDMAAKVIGLKNWK